MWTNGLLGMLIAAIGVVSMAQVCSVQSFEEDMFIIPFVCA